MRQTKEIATVFESQNYSINNIICDTMRKFKFKTLCVTRQESRNRYSSRPTSLSAQTTCGSLPHQLIANLLHFTPHPPAGRRYF